MKINRLEKNQGMKKNLKNNNTIKIEIGAFG